MNKKQLEKETDVMFGIIVVLISIILVGVYAHWYYYEYEKPYDDRIRCAIEIESCYTNFSISKEVCEPVGIYATFKEYDKIMISDKRLQHTLDKINKRVSDVLVSGDEQ